MAPKKSISSSSSSSSSSTINSFDCDDSSSIKKPKAKKVTKPQKAKKSAPKNIETKKLKPGEVAAIVCIVPGERALIKEFKSLGYDYITEPMDVGDIQIRTKDADGEWTNVELIIERKEAKDLLASIKDGRYDEQKQRIMTLFATNGLTPQKVYYMIEDFPEPTGYFAYDSQPRKCMWSAITNTTYRDKFNVFQTKNPAESAEWLNSLCNSVSKHYTSARTDVTVELKVHEANLKKKKVTPDDFLKHSLMLIKGVQDDVADAIAELYPTFSKLIEKYREMIDDDDNPATLFKDLKRISGSRKIGPVLSKRIYEYFENEV